MTPCLTGEARGTKRTRTGGSMDHLDRLIAVRARVPVPTSGRLEDTRTSRCIERVELCLLLNSRCLNILMLHNLNRGWCTITTRTIATAVTTATTGATAICLTCTEWNNLNRGIWVDDQVQGRMDKDGRPRGKARVGTHRVMQVTRGSLLEIYPACCGCVYPRCSYIDRARSAERAPARRPMNMRNPLRGPSIAEVT